MERSLKKERSQSSPGSCIDSTENPTKRDTKKQVKLQDPRKAWLAKCLESPKPTEKAMWLVTKHCQKYYSE